MAHKFGKWLPWPGMRRVVAGLALAGSVMLVSSCGGGIPTDDFSVGGQVKGLIGSGLVLQMNGGEKLEIFGVGPFVFKSKIWKGSSYDVQVITQPTSPSQTCLVAANGSGTSTKDVADVEIFCDFLEYTIGGSVSGNSGPIVLQNNGVDELTVVTDEPFQFSAKIAHGSDYLVTVLPPPTGQTCTVRNGAGTALAAVTNVAVVCSFGGFQVGGTVSGLKGVVYLQNDYEILAVTKDGLFTFPTAVAIGSTFDIRVYRQPIEQACSVNFGAGVMGSDANVTSVLVLCRSRLKVN